MDWRVTTGDIDLRAKIDNITLRVTIGDMDLRAIIDDTSLRATIDYPSLTTT
jgi:hypothetical protein